MMPTVELLEPFSTSVGSSVGGIFLQSTLELTFKFIKHFQCNFVKKMQKKMLSALTAFVV